MEVLPPLEVPEALPPVPAEAPPSPLPPEPMAPPEAPPLAPPFALPPEPLRPPAALLRPPEPLPPEPLRPPEPLAPAAPPRPPLPDTIFPPDPVQPTQVRVSQLKIGASVARFKGIADPSRPSTLTARASWLVSMPPSLRFPPLPEPPAPPSPSPAIEALCEQPASVAATRSIGERIRTVMAGIAPSRSSSGCIRCARHRCTCPPAPSHTGRRGSGTAPARPCRAPRREP